MKYTRIALIGVAATFFLFGVCGQAPAVPDKPKGPSQAMVDVAVACTTQTTDPKEADVAYQFDWGDGTRLEWSAYGAPGQPFVATHAYTLTGSYEVKVRARNSKKVSGWSEPLGVFVNPGEGAVRWDFAYVVDEDSADFSLNTFAIDDERDACYVGCEFGLVLARRLNKALRWRFFSTDEDEFMSPPSVGDDGTVYIGCANDSFYALNPDGSRKWASYLGDEVLAGAAIGTGGTVFVHTTGDSLLALSPAGARLWSYRTGGGVSSPVIGKDGTVFVASQDGTLYALDPSSGGRKWDYSMAATEIAASPAIDDALGVIYIADDEGRVGSVNTGDGSDNWQVRVGEGPSSLVIGPDHTVYLGADGKLYALNHESGAARWSYTPPMSFAAVSTPAVAANGSVYFLATLGKKDFSEPDTLYAVNADGSRRWACALGEGYSDETMSAPKLDSEGNIYIGSGLVGWCVRGASGPAASGWPMFQADGRSTGRAR